MTQNHPLTLQKTAYIRNYYQHLDAIPKALLQRCARHSVTGHRISPAYKNGLDGVVKLPTQFAKRTKEFAFAFAPRIKSAVFTLRLPPFASFR